MRELLAVSALTQPLSMVNLKDALVQLMVNTSQSIAKIDATLKSQEASIKNLEVQMGQIANILNIRLLSALPSDTERNLREHVEMVTLRNGKKLNTLEHHKKYEEKKEVA